MRTMLKSKIHRARVTDGNIAYEGSITIDKKLMEAADILPYEAGAYSEYQQRRPLSYLCH